MRLDLVWLIYRADSKLAKQEAINLVRSRRKGAIESKIQEEFIFAYRAVN